ncbi:MAG: hypothetical protein K2Q10_08435 [Rhodospirillales bacterium]|nr:hypothetical protein [Rhodospirillales bacterium]
MRVPNPGLPLDERLIVREGYRLAGLLLADYRDPPGPIEMFGKALADGREAVRSLFRSMARH